VGCRSLGRCAIARIAGLHVLNARRKMGRRRPLRPLRVVRDACEHDGHLVKLSARRPGGVPREAGLACWDRSGKRPLRSSARFIRPNRNGRSSAIRPPPDSEIMPEPRATRRPRPSQARESERGIPARAEAAWIARIGRNFVGPGAACRPARRVAARLRIPFFQSSRLCVRAPAPAPVTRPLDRRIGALDRRLLGPRPFWRRGVRHTR
jgi:hypothetical protein